MVFIPKTGKASHETPKYFRPISLSSFLLYMKSTITSSLLSDSQHAYRKAKSTETALDSIYIYLARTPEIGQGLGRTLSCGARKPEQT